MDAAELLEALVRIPSPTGHEDEAVQFLREQARRDGFRVLDDPVGNFVAEAGTGPRFVLFVGHIDTVPGDIPVRRDGDILHGRGTVDAKGPLVAAYVAARNHLNDSRLTVRIVGAVDEEGRSRGAKAVPTDLEPDWILIGEPSGANGLTLGYKGILRGVIVVERDHHHGAHPGPTAVEEAYAFWQTLAQRYNFDDRFDTVQGHLDAVHTSSDGLRDRVEAHFNLRLPPGMDPEVLHEALQGAAESQNVRVVVDERVRGHEADKRNALVASFLGAIRGEGGTPRLKRKTGTSDFSIFAERHPGVPIAAYGPGDASLDHTPNERASISELAMAVRVLDSVLGRVTVPSNPTAINDAPQSSTPASRAK